MAEIDGSMGDFDIFLWLSICGEAFERAYIQ